MFVIVNKSFLVLVLNDVSEVNISNDAILFDEKWRIRSSFEMLPECNYL